MSPGVLTPATVGSGEDKSVEIGGFEGGGEPGTCVIMSWEPCGFEAGDYTSFTIAES